MAYHLNCPRCGSVLTHVALGPQHAPYLCRECQRGWWASELSQEARAAYSRANDDFERHAGIRDAVLAEAALAHQRGTSLRPDQIDKVHEQTLTAILEFRLATDFAEAINTHLRKGES